MASSCCNQIPEDGVSRSWSHGSSLPGSEVHSFWLLLCEQKETFGRDIHGFLLLNDLRCVVCFCLLWNSTLLLFFGFVFCFCP